jgi:hypothetical protein
LNCFAAIAMLTSGTFFLTDLHQQECGTVSTPLHWTSGQPPKLKTVKGRLIDDQGF